VLAYAWYARRPSARRYLVVVAAFLCGLMSKPVVVTLPLVLLALDAWPLNRFARVGARKLVIEKLPLLALATAVGVLTYVGQRRAGAMTFLAHLSFRERLQHAVASCAIYLGQLWWPHPLAVLYPYARTGGIAALAALALLGLVTTIAIRVRAQVPSLLSGWLWFVATVAPMSGVIQVGAQSHADRFMYLPLAGLLVAVVWGAARLARTRWIAATLAAVAIAATMLASSSQVRLWKDSVTLMTHTVEVTPDNPIALHLLAESLVADGRVTEAIPRYQESLRLSPANPVGWYALGVAFNDSGRLSDAVVAFAEATHRDPTYGEAHYGLGATLLDLHQLDEARRELQLALQLPMPTEYAARAQFRLGLVAAYQHDLRRARDGFQAALQLQPDFREARVNLDKALAELAAERGPETVAKPIR
jgi:Flp pilus assembly protein TadD